MDETRLGGSNPLFTTTVWADIRALADPSDPRAREHLDRLFRTYWRPVYVYVRLKWNKPIEEAKDLTQAFFAHLLQKDPWARLCAEKGTFRTYLRRALQNFLINEKERQAVRREHMPTWSIDAAAAPVAVDEPPDRAYDREWFRCLMDASMAELKNRLDAESKSTYYEVFRLYCLPPDALPTYGEVANRMGLRESDVRYYLSYCRRVLRSIVRERIREYAVSDDDIERELREAAQ